MKAWLLIGLLALTACGADGPPGPPVLSTETTIGVNSRTGVYGGTNIGIQIGL